MHITQLLSGLLESYDFISTPLLNYWCSSLNIVMSIGYHHSTMILKPRMSYWDRSTHVSAFLKA